MGIIDRLFFRIEPGGDPKDRDSFSIKSIKHGLYKTLFNKSRISIVTGISKDLDEDMKNLKRYIKNFNRKIGIVNLIINSKDSRHIKSLKTELRKIKDILKEQYDEDKKEIRFTVQALDSIKYAIEDEDTRPVFEKEEELEEVLKDLRSDIERLEPILQRQIDFLKLPLDEQMAGLKRLFFDINDEAVIIGYEKDLVKKIKDNIDKFEIEVIENPG